MDRELNAENLATVSWNNNSDLKFSDFTFNQTICFCKDIKSPAGFELMN